MDCLVGIAHGIVPRPTRRRTLAHKPHHHHPHTHSASSLPTRRDFVSSLLSAAVLAPWALGQTQTRTPTDVAERFRQMSEDYEQKGLASPLMGRLLPACLKSARAAYRPSLCGTLPSDSSRP